MQLAEWLTCMNEVNGWSSHHFHCSVYNIFFPSNNQNSSAICLIFLIKPCLLFQILFCLFLRWVGMIVRLHLARIRIYTPSRALNIILSSLGADDIEAILKPVWYTVPKKLNLRIKTESVTVSFSFFYIILNMIIHNIRHRNHFTCMTGSDFIRRCRLLLGKCRSLSTSNRPTVLSGPSIAVYFLGYTPSTSIILTPDISI